MRRSFFANESQLAGLAPFPIFAFGAAFGDLDGDGLQDMAIGSYSRPIFLYRQGPDGTFDRSELAGSGSARIPVFADMNGDGHFGERETLGTLFRMAANRGRTEQAPQDLTVGFDSADVYCRQLTRELMGERSTDRDFRDITRLGERIADGGFPGIADLRPDEIMMPYK